MHTPISTYTSTLLPKMEGWCTPAKAQYIYDLVTATRPRLFVEIGVYAGRSLFAAALAMQHLSHGHCIGIDPWDTSASVTGFTGPDRDSEANRDWWGRLDHNAIYDKCVASCTALGLDDTVTLFRASSAKALVIIRQLPPINLLHIDGNHSEASALFDVQNYAPLVAPGSTILFDDMDWNTTRAAQHYLATVATLSDTVATTGVYTKR